MPEDQMTAQAAESQEQVDAGQVFADAFNEDDEAVKTADTKESLKDDKGGDVKQGQQDAEKQEETDEASEDVKLAQDRIKKLEEADGDDKQDDQEDDDSEEKQKVADEKRETRRFGKKDAKKTGDDSETFKVGDKDVKVSDFIESFNSDDDPMGAELAAYVDHVASQKAQSLIRDALEQAGYVKADDVAAIKAELANERYLNDVAGFGHTDVRKILVADKQGNGPFWDWLKNQRPVIKRIVKEGTPEEAADVLTLYKNDVMTARKKEADTAAAKEKQRQDDIHRHSLRDKDTGKFKQSTGTGRYVSDQDALAEFADEFNKDD